MDEFRKKSGEGRKKFVITALQGELPATDDSPKYAKLSMKAKIVAWTKESLVGTGGTLGTGDEVGLVLDKTCFYAEQGGQVGDRGSLTTPTGTFDIEDTQRLGDAVLHLGRVREGTVKCGQQATLQVSGERADTMRNHTATHLLNWALRRVLGDHIEQKGSLVDPEKTRFDFAHDHAVKPDEIAEIERLVNERIYADLDVTATVLPLADANRIPGVRAVFGEKYPDPVRVLVIGAAKPDEATAEHSVEFCGGTHLHHTGEAGFFKIVSQEAVGKGVRRLTAVTGREAVAAVQRMSAVLDELVGRFNCKPAEIPDRVQTLQDEIKKLQQQLKKGAAGDMQSAADKLLAGAVEVSGAKIVVGEMPSGPDEALRAHVDRMKQKLASGAVVVGWTDDAGKVGLLVAATDDMVKKGLHAGKLVGQLAKVVGGGGGGKPTMAQAGGKDPSKLGEALALAMTLVKQQVAV